MHSYISPNNSRWLLIYFVFIFKAESYYIGRSLDFEAEFRTSELNGILMSISEPQGYPALSLELTRGKVFLTCSTFSLIGIYIFNLLNNAINTGDFKWRYGRSSTI